MKYCDKCKVQVTGSRDNCPLCQRKLAFLDKEKEDDVFPYIPTIYQKYQIILKTFIFLSIAIVIVSILFNLMLPGKVFWSFFVLAGMICFWSALFVAFKKRRNIPKNILYQVVLLSLLCVAWDYFTGFNGWSVDFVIPILCLAALFLLYILSKIMKSDDGDYLIYILIGIVFGIVPVLFSATGILHFVWPSFICVASSVVFLAAVLVFQGDRIKAELRRRFHF